VLVYSKKEKEKKISASSFDPDNLIVKNEKVRRRYEKDLLCSGDTGPP
jgi:hypothetical protein